MSRYISKRVRKIDAMQLVTGKPVYADDLAPADCLIVRLLRSPHAFARVKSVNSAAAMKVPGMVAVFSHFDAPDCYYTQAGQTAPELSPHDRRVLDELVRFVGDPVAIVAGETEEAVSRAMRMIKVEYEVLEPVLDYHQSLDNPIVIHPEPGWNAPAPSGGDPKRNLVTHGVDEGGDVDAVLASCDYTVEAVYETQAAQQCMMEPFTTFCELDPYGRLKVTSSTQIPFHVRRIVSNALGIPKSQVRVLKPRIGGGFGAKQTAVSEVYPAFVTWKTGRPAKLVFTREECMIAGSPRHPMTMHVRIGANRDGHIRAVDLHTLSDTGAYGEHGPTTVTLSGHKSIPLYGKLEAFRFTYDVVYSNHQSSGAYRGYGATQGIFAVESAVDELAHRMGVDPALLRQQNLVQQGQIMPAYYGEPCASCTLDQCVSDVLERIGWREYYPRRVMPDGKIRAVGMALAMQGSGISGVDVGSVTVSLTDFGYYRLEVGCSDMGTGCDTILAQMVAESMDCDISRVMVHGVDTDSSPYDSGSYASSTTFVTGTACVRACEALRKKLLDAAAEALGCDVSTLQLAEDCIYDETSEKKMTLEELGLRSQCGTSLALTATASNSYKYSPPPFMAGAALIELDPETGKVTMLDYAATVDCGTVINENLARVQTEGGIAQAIGMTLFEGVDFTEKGKNVTANFLTYHIPTRRDTGPIRVEFRPSFEPAGPFGAKSIGEIVIDTPAPAIANAIDNAVGVRLRTLPITAEKICMALRKKAQ